MMVVTIALSSMKMMNTTFLLELYSKTCVKQPLKKNTKYVFKTNYHLMQVKSIAECSKRAFCNTFDLHLATICL